MKRIEHNDNLMRTEFARTTDSVVLSDLRKMILPFKEL